MTFPGTSGVSIPPNHYDNLLNFRPHWQPDVFFAVVGIHGPSRLGDDFFALRPDARVERLQ